MKLRPYVLNQKTADVEIPAVFSEVTLNKETYETFLSYPIPLGWLMVVIQRAPLHLCLKDVGGDELLRGRLLIGVLKPNASRVIAFNAFNEYSTYRSMGWQNQLNKNYRDSILVDISYDYAVIFQGETLCFQIYNCDKTLPAAPHVDTLVKYDVQLAEMQEYESAARAEGQKGKALPGY